MSGIRIAAVLVFVAVISATFALSQPSDFAILARIGKVTGETVRGGIPDNARLAGSLAAFRAGDALTVEERVRVRIQSDKDMTGAEVNVVMTANGEVKLKGLVQSTSQKNRALDLAERTAGVQTVIDELALPVGQ
ncbi:hypothetical protein BH11PLA2_BH11PLA2_34070 [soil metagenome]